MQKMHRGGKVQENEVRFMSNSSNKDLIDVSDFLHVLSQDTSLTPFPIIKTKEKA